MKCQKVLKLLPLYISDDLDAFELKTVEDHLGECLNCYREYQAHLKALRDLKRLGEKPDLSTVLAGFSGEVMDRIVRDEGGPSAPVPKVTYAFVPRMIAAAAVLLLIITGVFLLQGPDDTTPELRSDKTPPAWSVGIDPYSESYFIPWGAEEDEGALRPDKRKSMEEENLLNPWSPRFPPVQPVRFRRDF